MAWFADLAPCWYFTSGGDRLRAVGWLEQGHPFTKGAVPAAFLGKLEELLEELVWPIRNQYRGMHGCTLCSPGRPWGAYNLFVPWKGGLLVAPELVRHYIVKHHYQP